MLPKPNPLEELPLFEPFESSELLDELALLELLELLDEDALAAELEVFKWVAASDANATKLPSVTPRITFLSARAFSSACALGMRVAADFAARGIGPLSAAVAGWTRAGWAGRVGKSG